MAHTARRHPTRGSKSRRVRKPDYAPHPSDACTEAAARILVAIRLINEQGDPPDDQDDQGYGLSIVREVLANVRALLLASAHAHSSAPVTEGGAR